MTLFSETHSISKGSFQLLDYLISIKSLSIAIYLHSLIKQLLYLSLSQ